MVRRAEQILDWYKIFYGDPERVVQISIAWENLIPIAADVVGTRGQGKGQLLEEPFDDGMGIEGRGVRQDWLYAFANDTIGKGGQMNGETGMGRRVATRVWQGFVGKAMTLEHQCPLYCFVPPEFRGKPDVFLSHSWDQNIREALVNASSWKKDVNGFLEQEQVHITRPRHAACAAARTKRRAQSPVAQR